MMQSSLSQTLSDKLRALVGEDHVFVKPADMAPFLQEWRGHFEGRAAAVVCPADTGEVAAVVKCCAQAGVGVVPQGGNTGLVGGAAAQSAQHQIVLSMRRMRRVRALDTDNDSITVEAGCVLAQLQKTAADADRLFPLSLASEGSCQIGGNLATNAGGVNVLRYGNARALCLGLEVVLADGRIWRALGGLRKDNSGYDLKQLFIGSEGSLGIITAATLKLFPRPKQQETAFIALADAQAAITLLQELRHETGDNLVACELIPRLAVELTSRHIEYCRDPFEQPYPWYVLVEAATPAPGNWLRTALEGALAQALEKNYAQDVTIAESLKHAQDFWRIREHIPEAQVREGQSIKHDVSVAVSRIPELLARATAAVEAAEPGVRVCAFGHVGDGNLHFNLTAPESTGGDEFMAQAARLNRIVHDIAVDMDGSFSAEHGVGRLKVDELARYKSAESIDLMQQIKRALDPNGVMNPGAVVPAPE